jgi:hypothetical protein
MVLTVEEKLAVVCIALLLSVIAGVTAVSHFIDVGKADEKAAVFAAEQKAQAKAVLTEASWQVKLTDATAARAKELSDAESLALKPVSVSVQHITLRTAVSSGPAAPAASPSPPSSGAVCAGLVPGSSAEMRSFDDAKSADALIADYRDLYNSWPSQITKGATH